MRRPGPRALAEALGPVRRELTPATLLARVQEAWPEIAGLAAREAAPVSERAGTVTFECRSSVWAGELSLMAEDLRTRLNVALGDGSEVLPVGELRFVTGASRRRS